MKTKIFTILTLIFTWASLSQTKNKSHFKSDLILSERQMLEDLDSLQVHIKKAGIHSVLNKHLKGINLDAYFKKYRASINKNTNATEFAIIVDQILNLVQDGHANMVLNPKNIESAKKFIKREKIVFDTLAFNYAKNYNKLFETLKTDFELPIKYIDGKYFVTIPFEYKGIVFKSGFELIECNSQSIEKILPTLISEISPMRWDIKNKIYYKDNFYKAQKFVTDGKINLGFKNDSGHIIRQQFNFDDSVTLLKKPVRKIGYFSQEEEKVIYFDKENILYLRIPKMDRDKVTFYTNKIDSINNLGSKISKLILDIRGNGGGSDRLYTGILKHIVSEPLNEPYKVAFPKNDFILSYFGFKPTDVTVQRNTLLGNSSFYLYGKNKKIKPDSTSIKYKNQIFILQDEFVYSAAGNLSALAKSNSNIITIGNRTGLCGGKQTSPIYFSLPNSKLVYRLEPMLDFSNVNKIEDIFHDEVTHYIIPTFEDYQRRLFSENDIYSIDFLREFDPLFKVVVDY